MQRKGKFPPLRYFSNWSICFWNENFVAFIQAQCPMEYLAKVATNEVHTIYHPAIAAVGIILISSYVRNENYLAYSWFSREYGCSVMSKQS